MDTTMQYYISMIEKNKGNRKVIDYAKIVKDEIDSYRTTAFLNRGRNIASMCNHTANLLEKSLNRALR